MKQTRTGIGFRGICPLWCARDFDCWVFSEVCNSKGVSGFGKEFNFEVPALLFRPFRSVAMFGIFSDVDFSSLI